MSAPTPPSVDPGASARQGWRRFISHPRGRVALAVVAVVLVLAVASAVPTRIGPLVSEYPAFHDRSHRRPPPPGACTLGDAQRTAARCAPVTVGAVREVEVTFPSTIPDRGVPSLRGTLTVPLGMSGPRPAVVVLGGSGPQTRDGVILGELNARFRPPFGFLRALSGLLAREGLVVLRYDKRDPTNYPALATPAAAGRFRYDDLQRDANDALDFLATRPEVDPHALLVVGHDEGGAIAVHLGSERRDLAGVIALAASYDVRDPAALIATASARLRQLDGLGYVALRAQAYRWTRCVSRVRTAFDPDEHCVDDDLPQRRLRERLEFSDATMARVRAVRAPFLALQGTIDRTVAPNSLLRVRAALAGVPEADFELHYAAQVSHSLIDAEDPSDPLDRSPGVQMVVHPFLLATAWPGGS